MRLYKYIDGQIVQRFPVVINLFIERMQENWQGMFFGIMLIVYAIVSIVGLFIPFDNITFSIFMGIIVLILITSAIFHAINQVKIPLRDMERSKREFLDFCNKNTKHFK